ncbi:MAG TPA: glycosyltransferase family 1 protein [Bacteroidota bacterium]|nr:glycosyltransferase family 1 protein [Bacteroidota bacterium]
MRIAYFNANLRKGQDGVTRVMYKMFEGAVARNVEAIAFASTLPDADDAIIPTYKVPSVVLPIQKSYRLALPSYHLFARRLNAFRPDIVHINSPCTLGLGALRYATHYDLPVVATYHTHFPTYPRYYRMEGLEEVVWKVSRRLYNNMDRTFVPSVPILEELKEHDIERLEYLPNGVDLSLFHPTRRSGPWRSRFGAGQKPVVLFVSRLVWEKDLAVLADVYSLLRSRGCNFEMVVVGDGHARNELEMMMPGAHFLGSQTGTTLAESYASSDIFVFPSTTETFGLVTLEAMASGLVPVAANVGGAAEIVQDGVSGIHVPPLDRIAMANEIERLLNNAHLRESMRAAAFRRANQYGWETILEQLFASYADVIDSSNRGRRSRAA